MHNFKALVLTFSTICQGKLLIGMDHIAIKVFPIIFSNSLIIHKEKTKEITTVTVVWIPDLNEHKILRTFALNFSKNYEWFEKPYQKLERVFHQVSKHLELG